jgi:hypothetical protein
VKIGRNLTVRVAAWALRRGVDIGTLADALATSHPWRPPEWASEVIDEAQERNGLVRPKLGDSYSFQFDERGRRIGG